MSEEKFHNSVINTVLKHPLFCIVFIISITLLSLVGLLQLEIHSDGASIYPKNNKIINSTKLNRKIFNDLPYFILLVGSKNKIMPVNSASGFRYLKKIHRDLADRLNIPHDSILSIASLYEIRYVQGAINVDYFLEKIPVSSHHFQEWVKRVQKHPLVNGLFLSSDGNDALIFVPLLKNIERKTFLNKIKLWMDTRQDRNFSIDVTGPMVAEITLGDVILTDLSRIIPLMVVVIAIMLLLTLRSIGSLLITISEALIVLTWTFGLMGFLNIPVTLVATILPVLLMTITITDEVHLLQRFQSLINQGYRQGEYRKKQNDLHEIILLTLEQVGKPIAVTSLTTAIGFISFLTASILPIQQFGFLTAFGILAAMFLSFTFIPAMIMILPISLFKPKFVFIGKIKLFSFEKFIANNTKKAFILGIIIILVSLPGLVNLSIQDSWVENFAPESRLAIAEKRLNSGFWGSYRFDIIIKGPQKYFYQAKGTRLISRMTRLVLKAPGVGGALSYLLPIKEIAAGLGFKKKLTLFEDNELDNIFRVTNLSGMGIHLSPYLTKDGSMSRLTLFVNSPDYQKSIRLKKYLEEKIKHLTTNRPVIFQFSGDIPNAIEVVDAIVLNQMRSIFFTLVGIGFLIFFTFSRQIKYLFILIPAGITPLIIFSIMGHIGIPLGIATSMFASLSIGIGLDFALHFYYNYKYEVGVIENHAIINTFKQCGKVIRWNVLVLIMGFSILMFSNISPNRSLGLLLSLSMFISYVITVLFLPYLLTRLSSRKK